MALFHRKVDAELDKAENDAWMKHAVELVGQIEDATAKLLYAAEKAEVAAHHMGKQTAKLESLQRKAVIRNNPR